MSNDTFIAEYVQQTTFGRCDLCLERRLVEDSLCYECNQTLEGVVGRSFILRRSRIREEGRRVEIEEARPHPMLDEKDGCSPHRALP